MRLTTSCGGQRNISVATGYYVRAALIILAVSFAVLFFGFTGAVAESGIKGEKSNYAYVGGDYAGIDHAAKSVFYVEVYDSDYACIATGSGFVMFNERLFVTNQHVIEGASFLLIMDDDGKQYVLDQVVVSDASHDIAILLFPDAKYQYDPLQYDTAFDQLTRGQAVLAIGSPKGLPGTVSDGIISAFPKLQDSDTRYIQITAPISHGSSGGCLLNDKLKVIGVTSSGVETGENLGFAIPVSIVEKLYRQWNKRDTVTLGSQSSWDTVGFGIHNTISGSSWKTLVNLDFSSWDGFICWYMNDGYAESYIDNGVLVFDIFTPGSDPWSVQLTNVDFQLIQGAEYALSWDMKSTTDRDVEICIQHYEGDWNVYYAQAFPATNTMRHYIYKFTMTEATDTTPQLAINMGKLDTMPGTAAMKQHQVYIDNIQLKVLK